MLFLGLDIILHAFLSSRSYYDLGTMLKRHSYAINAYLSFRLALPIIRGRSFTWAIFRVLF